MSLAQSMLPEFDQEMANTRKVLERVPDGKFTWKPHAKSWDLGGLATHVATLPHWTTITLNQDKLDVAPPGGPPAKNPPATSRAELLSRFDEVSREARASLAAAADGTMTAPWTLLAGGNEVFTMPRAAVLRSFVMNHLIHHRAQLGMYLRLNDVPLPSLYGPTADEPGM